MNLLASLDTWRLARAAILSFTLTVLIGVIDFLTGYELSFSVFYLIPISLLAWVGGRWWGLACALLGTLVASLADFLTGHVYSSPVYIYWNAGMRLVLFVTIAILLSTVKVLIEQEKRLARVDHLTGAANSRSFLETLSAELDRSRRYKRPFTLAYIDLDNFKVVNDSLGHGAGDEVLQTVVDVIREQIRRTDVVARLGGDEFALLLPETDHDAARIAIEKIRSSLLSKMNERHWPVTASIGSLTCRDARLSVDQLIKQADDLMYEAKLMGKNTVSFSPASGL